MNDYNKNQTNEITVLCFLTRTDYIIKNLLVYYDTFTGSWCETNPTYLSRVSLHQTVKCVLLSINSNIYPYIVGELFYVPASFFLDVRNFVTIRFCIKLSNSKKMIVLHFR